MTRIALVLGSSVLPTSIVMRAETHTFFPTVFYKTYQIRKEMVPRR
jgi:hypothetical protein